MFNDFKFARILFHNGSKNLGLLEERMNKEEQEHKQFLEQQLQWCKKRDCILEEIEVKLHEMKKIAQYTLDNKLTAIELD